MVDFKKLNRSMKATIQAKNDFEFIHQGLELDDFQKERYWKRMVELIQKMYPPKQDKPTVDSMSDSEVEEFEGAVIKFGKHSGKKYGDVPLEYLIWLNDQSSKLRRYLNNPRIKREIENG